MLTFRALLMRDLKQLVRNQSSIASILLYVFSTSFIVFAMFSQLEPLTWVSIYWIIVVLSIATNATHSFGDLKGIQAIHDYQLASSEAIFLSRLFSVLMVSLLIAFATFLALSLFSISPIANGEAMIFTVLLGTFFLSVLFCFVGFLIGRSNTSAGLMPILSFPLMIPTILILAFLSKIAIGASMDVAYFDELMMLLALCLLILAISLLLIPYLWKS